MSDNSYYAIIDILVAACGIYVIVQYIMMVRTGKIRQNMLLPNQLEVEKCKDTEGYIRFIGVRQLVFGLAAIACGGINLVQDMMGMYNVVVSMIVLAVFLVFCVWYSMAVRKAQREFW